MSCKWGVVLSLAAAVLATGCRSQPSAGRCPPHGVRLLALTGTESAAAGQPPLVRAFVRPLGTAQAATCRFELYEFVPYNANPRGKRLMLWPQIEPGPPLPENPNWQPPLEAYEITLPLQGTLPTDKHLLLEVTALMPDGSRCSDTVEIKTIADF